MGSTWDLVVRNVSRAVAARRRRDEEVEEGAEEEGFTLIELMVVLLIMGILLAIAIPTFLGASAGAHDRAAQSNLTNAMTSAQTIYAQQSKYTVTTATNTFYKRLISAEPELTFKTSAAGSTTQNVISVGVASTSEIFMASLSKTTKACWLAMDTADTTGVQYGFVKDTNKAAATCSASTAAALASTKWKRSYPAAPAGY